MKIALLPIASLTALSMALVAPAQANGLLAFTDRIAFLNAIQPGFYLEDFSSLPNGFIASTTIPFSDSNFSYEASVPGPTGFFTVSPGGNQALSTQEQADPITFTDFTPNITAIGGFFFGTDFNAEPMEVTVTASVNGGSAELSQLTNSPTNFFGFVSTHGTPILSLVTEIGSPTVQEFITVDDLIVGQAVPEPLTLLGASAAIAFGAAFKKRKAQ